MDDKELIASVGAIGRRPVRPGIIPTQQNISTPQTLTPNSGVRVDEGVLPTPSSINGNGEQAPRVPLPTPASAPTPAVQNPVPENSNSPSESQQESSRPAKKKKKKGSLKTTLISVGLGAGLIVILLLLIVLKDKGPTTPGDVLTNPTPPTSDIVQEFQEYDDPFGLGGEDEWIVSTFEYTEQEYADLRRVGYTSSEIEDFKSKELEAAPLIEQAKEERKAYLDETVAPYYDGRSDEFKKLEQDTWVGLPMIEDSSIPDTTEELDTLTNRQVTINTDFEKVEPRGNQLFIKVYTDKKHSSWVYYQCSFYQWYQLEDEGNIVAEATITTFETEDTVCEIWKIDTIIVY